jgi:hypothetical protein
MNIVRITSGLGNQMFQYAFYRAVKSNWPDTKIDVSEFRHRSHHNGYELERIFEVSPDHASRKECDSLADVSKDLLSEFRRRVLRVRLKCTGTLVRESELGAWFHPELLTMRNGYFQASGRPSATSFPSPGRCGRSSPSSSPWTPGTAGSPRTSPPATP